jgi:hypothetical protein
MFRIPNISGLAYLANYFSAIVACHLRGIIFAVSHMLMRHLPRLSPALWLIPSSGLFLVSRHFGLPILAFHDGNGLDPVKFV